MEIQERIVELTESISQLTSDVAWLVKLGKWFLSAVAALLMVAATLLLPMAVRVYEAQGEQDRRISLLEGGMTSVSNHIYNINGQAKKDHQACHGWKLPSK